MDTKVYLIGAGAGDVGLLTMKGRRLVKTADTVLYDKLVGSEIVSMIPPNARAIYVGKKAGEHSMTQEEINELLVAEAKKGGRIVRLKGGDPFVFGRGGEEVLALIDAGIDFEVVPGVTSAIAALTYSGIPITHREIARSFHVFTGHFKSGTVEEHIDFDAISKLNGTLVFLMGLGNLSSIVKGLIAAGKASDTAVAVIENGTLPYQRHVLGTLDTIENVVAENKIKTPAIVAVGKVVEFSSDFYREKARPLLGKKIVVTRSRVQSSELSLRLEELGAKVIECPAIKAVPVEMKAEQLEILECLREYQWLIFTSANSVKSFFKILLEHQIDYRALSNIKICVVGKVTKKVLLEHGFIADLVPKNYHAAEMFRSLLEHLNQGDKILRVRGGFADQSLIRNLSREGFECDELTVYDITAGEFSERAKNIVDADAITFTSGSTVTYFSEFLEQYKLPVLLQTMEEKTCVCIGPITAQGARKAGYKNVEIAEQHTIKGVIDKVLESVNNNA